MPSITKQGTYKLHGDVSRIFQDILDFRDQYMALRKVCTKLGLRFERCEEDAKAVLLKEGVASPSKEQLDKL